MITITGATGLLGSRVLFDLLAENDKIRALKRKTSSIEVVREVFSYYTENPDEYFQKIEWRDFDILDIDSVMEALEGTTRLYHNAAYVSFDPRDKKQMMVCNVQGTANIVNACLDSSVEKLCHVSSTSALGAAFEGDSITEDLVWKPDKVKTHYAHSKFRSEMEVWRGIEEGLNAVIVNPSIIFGPGFWNKGSSGMFTKIEKGLRYYTTGVTGFVSVKDVSKCMIRLMNSDISGERFIISSENLSYQEVFTMIAKSLGVPPPSIEATPFLAGIAWRLDAFRSLFGFKRMITREVAEAGRNKNYFSNEKIKKMLGVEFEKIEETVREVGKMKVKNY